jgi:hypothetical protein
MAGQSGQGSTVAFTTAGAVGCARSMTLPNWSMETIDASCLEDVGFMKKVGADLVDGGEVEIVVLFEIDDVPFTPSGDIDTITITIPSKTGGTDATLSGTGFISSTQLPSLASSELMEQTITFVFDGQTGPTWTAGTNV